MCVCVCVLQTWRHQRHCWGSMRPEQIFITERLTSAQLSANLNGIKPIWRLFYLIQILSDQTVLRAVQPLIHIFKLCLLMKHQTLNGLFWQETHEPPQLLRSLHWSEMPCTEWWGTTVRSFGKCPTMPPRLKRWRTAGHCGAEGERCVCRLTDASALTGDISPAGHHATFISILQLAYLFMASSVFTAQNKWLMWHSTSLHIINTGNKSSLSRLLPTRPSSDPPPLAAGSASRPLSSQHSYTRHMWISELQLILRVDWK